MIAGAGHCRKKKDSATRIRDISPPLYLAPLEVFPEAGRYNSPVEVELPADAWYGPGKTISWRRQDAIDSAFQKWTPGQRIKIEKDTRLEFQICLPEKTTCLRQSVDYQYRPGNYQSPYLNPDEKPRLRGDVLEFSLYPAFSGQGQVLVEPLKLKGSTPPSNSGKAGASKTKNQPPRDVNLTGTEKGPRYLTRINWYTGRNNRFEIDLKDPENAGNPGANLPAGWTRVYIVTNSLVSEKEAPQVDWRARLAENEKLNYTSFLVSYQPDFQAPKPVLVRTRLASNPRLFFPLGFHRLSCYYRRGGNASTPWLPWERPIEPRDLKDLRYACLPEGGGGLKEQVIAPERIKEWENEDSRLTISPSRWFRPGWSATIQASPETKEDYVLLYTTDGSLPGAQAKEWDWSQTSFTPKSYTRFRYGLVHRERIKDLANLMRGVEKDTAKDGAEPFSIFGEREYFPLPEQPTVTKDTDESQTKKGPEAKPDPDGSRTYPLRSPRSLIFSHIPLYEKDIQEALQKFPEVLQPEKLPVARVRLADSLAGTLRELSSKKWKNPYYQAVSTVLNMEPASLYFKGSNLEKYNLIAEDLVNTEVLPAPEEFFALIYGVNPYKKFFTVNDLRRVILDFFVKSYPGVDKEGAIDLTFADLLQNLKPLERFQKKGKNGHTGLFYKTPQKDLLTDNMAIELPVVLREDRPFGLAVDRPGTEPAAYLSAYKANFAFWNGSYPDGLYPRLTGYKYEKLNFVILIRENPTGLIEAGSYPTKDQKGESPAWKQPPWVLERMLVEMAWRRYGNPPAKTKVFSNENFGGKLGELFVGSKKYGLGSFVKFEPFGVLKNEAPAVYAHEALAVAAQVMIHENGVLEGNGHFMLPVFNIPINYQPWRFSQALRPALFDAKLRPFLAQKSGAIPRPYPRQETDIFVEKIPSEKETGSVEGATSFVFQLRAADGSVFLVNEDEERETLDPTKLTSPAPVFYKKEKQLFLLRRDQGRLRLLPVGNG